MGVLTLIWRLCGQQLGPIEPWLFWLFHAGVWNVDWGVPWILDPGHWMDVVGHVACWSVECMVDLWREGVPEQVVRKSKGKYGDLGIEPRSQYLLDNASTNCAKRFLCNINGMQLLYKKQNANAINQKSALKFEQPYHVGTNHHLLHSFVLTWKKEKG